MLVLYNVDRISRGSLQLISVSVVHSIMRYCLFDGGGLLITKVSELQTQFHLTALEPYIFPLALNKKSPVLLVVPCLNQVLSYNFSFTNFFSVVVGSSSFLQAANEMVTAHRPASKLRRNRLCVFNIFFMIFYCYIW